MAKQYQSIIRLFEHSGIDTTSEINLQRAKKQISAEFDFSESGFIELDGHTYNKADVIEELEHPEFNERLIYHKRIWESKYILAMLEDYEFNYLEFRDQMKAFNNDPAFDIFFSPYFTQAFIYCSRTYLERSEFESVGQLLLFEEFINGDNREEAFVHLRVFFEDNIRVFRNLTAENYTAFKQKISIWPYRQWSEMFNQLPHELYDYKAEFAFHLINLTVLLQRRELPEATSISQELVRMKDLPDELYKTIKSNHKIFMQTDAGSEGGGISWGWVIWIVLILLRLAAGC